MPRRSRIEYPGAIYHVIQRGNNREFIFDKVDSKGFMLRRFMEMVEKEDVEMFAYVIMGNHFHLALRTWSRPLSKVMQKINTKFGVYYNKTKGRTGHVFEGRYKAIPIQDERYLLTVVRYIHRNPVRAQICFSVKDYRWSSDVQYRTSRKGFVNSDLLLNLLSNNKAKALAEYNLLMETADDKNLDKVSFIGDDAFYVEMEKDKQLIKTPLDEILIQTGAGDSEIELIKSGSRLRNLLPYKVAYAKQALEQGYSMEEISRHISITAPAIFQWLKKEGIRGSGP